MSDSNLTPTTKAISTPTADKTSADRPNVSGEGRADHSPLPTAIKTLEQAATGLLFPSETDAPLTPFFWSADNVATLTPERLPEFIQAPADASIKSVKLENFFRSVTTREDWHNEEEEAEVTKFQELLSTIKATLKEVKVFRVGEIKVDVYIVGKTDEGYAGLQTTVVET